MRVRSEVLDDSVSSLRLREAISLDPSTRVRTAIEQMKEARLGCAVIVDAKGKPTGIFTERSLIDLLAEEASLDTTRVGDFPDPQFLAVKSTDPLQVVWEAIVKDGQRFICVTDDSGKLIGLTGQRGLAEFISEYFPQQVMVQHLGGKPWLDQREGA